ncbi:MAG: DUF1624 domain-containing protein [Polyangiales bacterium]
MNRDRAVDRLRGLVIVLMALDHARDFFGDPRRDPTDLATTTPILFLTRFVTHYCAPIFIFLAGVSAGLMLARGDGKREVAKFTASRGLFLVFLELTVVRLAWTFDPAYRFTPFQVIWAIGLSMIACAGLVYLPRGAVIAVSIAGIALHAFLDRIPLGPRWLAAILHRPALLQPFEGHAIYVIYPLIPWVFVMSAGLAFAPVLKRPDRGRLLVGIGLALVALFFVVRGLNGYGDPHPWSHARPLISFFNVEKYPPSLDYLLITLGPALILLAVLDRDVPFLETFGAVPLFFYVAHLYLLHGAAAITRAIVPLGPRGPGPFGGAVRASLPFVYLAWLVALLVLYPLCVRYAALKRRRRDIALLRYL